MADIAPAEPIIIDLDEAAPAASAEQPGVVVLSEDGDAGEDWPARARRQADGSAILPLREAVVLRYRRAGSEEVREECVDQLHLHRLTGKDMRAVIAASREAQPVVAMARSARIAEAKFSPIYDQMDGADVSDAMAVVGFFLGNGRKTGR